MLTPEGQHALALDTAARFKGGTVRVSDGTASAEAPILEVSVSEGHVRVGAEFGGQEANFEWKIRELVGSDGTVLDRTLADMGRKSEGSVWTVDASVGFEAESEDDDPESEDDDPESE